LRKADHGRRVDVGTALKASGERSRKGWAEEGEANELAMFADSSRAVRGMCYRAILDWEVR